MEKKFFEDIGVSTRQEQLMIYSIVNTLAVKMGEVKSVKILLGGLEISTFAEDIDIKNPLKPNLSLVQ